MKFLSQILASTALVAGAIGMSSCSSVGQFDSTAYQASDLNGVAIKVSLENMMAYVMEGNKALLVTPVTIGTPEDPTPKGTFKVFQKIEKKRSYTYGFHVSDTVIRPGESRNLPRGQRYVGYPMPYWVEFHPGYGFHSGGVWPMPRSHGCLRVHKTVAPKLFELTKVGTPVYIADRQPEDQTIGKGVVRPSDYADPDPPASFLITDKVFTSPPRPLFSEGPAPTVH